MDFQLTPATPDDIPSLLELIRELARFEQLEVEATVESLNESLFGARPVAGALLARLPQNRGLAGYALYFFTFSSFLGRAGIWLEDLYVRPPFRKQGLGRALIEAVAQVGAARNCGRFEWTALDWNANALDFYRKLGAEPLKQWVVLRMNAQGLRQLANNKTTAAR